MENKYATPEGTEKFFHLHELHPNKKRKLDDVLISAIGIGSYLGDCDDRSDHLFEKALVNSVNHGVNFFDTANIYRCERSEKVIGKALKELNDQGVTRDQIFIASKAGFIPNNSAESESYVRATYLEKEILQTDEIVSDCHSLATNFLNYEIEKSLKKMDISALDLFYLHNPEIQLSEIPENEFYERLKKAFELLEMKVQEGKIRRYGIATWNGFRLKPAAKGLLNLSKINSLAKSISGENHHFKAIQLPFNLVMLEALKVANQINRQEEKVSIFKAAEDFGIHVMVSAPLMQSQLLNLPRRIFDTLPSANTSLQKALQFVLSNPYVTSAMVGMKTPAHVHENLKVLQEPIWNQKALNDTYKILGLKYE